MSRAPRVERDISELTTAEALAILNDGGRVIMRCLADTRRGVELVAAAGPGRPIVTMFQHTGACSPDVCRCVFTVAMERPDAARLDELVRLSAQFARESLS